MSAPVTLGLAIALVGASLTAIVARDVTSATQAEATVQLTQQVGFNARTWTMTQPDDSGIRYIGGEFTSFNAWNTGRGAWVDATSGEVDPTFRAVSDGSVGGVQASVPDGNGGVFIAGRVTGVGSTGRNGLALIRSDGTVDPIFASTTVSDEIWAMAADDSAVYIGGKFTQVNGQPRNYVAALDRATGALLDWNPNANSWVHALLVDDSTVYIGGRFTTVGGSARVNAARVQTASCLTAYQASCLTDFAPPISANWVFDFARYGTALYIGGRFSATAAGTTISTLIKVDPSTGALDTTWNPSISGNTTWGVSTNSNPAGPTVYAMDISADTLYVGGKFTTVGGQSRLRLAAFDLANGGALINSWAPTTSASASYGNENNIEIQDAVSAIEVVGSKVYVGGGIAAINGQPRNRVGAVHATTGATDPFDPHACDATNGVPSHVRTITALGQKVFLGGTFNCMGGLKRYYVAAVGPDGILTDWNPHPNGSVTAMSSDGQTIFMTGRFTRLNDQPRQFAGAVQIDESLTAWNPTLERGFCDGGERQEVLQTTGAVYVAGCFTTVGGQARPRLAKTDRTTGAVDLGFNANPGTGWIRALAHEGSRLYVGGFFSTMGGQNRSWIAAVDDSTGAVDMGWDAGPIVSAHDAAIRTAIYDIEPSSDDTRLYIGGFFGTINGQSQRFLAALDKSTGALDTTWRPVVAPQACSGWDCGLMSIDQYDDTVYIAGAAGNPVPGTAIGAVSAIDGSVSTWMNNSGTGEVRGISVNDATAFIAGNFSSVAGNARGHTAAIDLRGPVLAPWPMNAAEAAPLTVAITAADDTTSGAVVSNPGGINCGGTCEYAYPTTQTVTLQAVPKPAADFAGWTGACSGFATSCTVTMSSARSAIASFAPAGSVVTPSPTPSASASASPTPSASASPSASPTPTASATPTSGPGPGPGPVPVPTPTPEPRSPGAPTSVTAEPRGTTATVTWTPPADPGSAPITSYRVVASPGGGTCFTTTTSCTVDGLTPGTAYTFTVTALNSVDWGTPSAVSTPVTVPLIEIRAGARTIEGRKDRIVITGTAVGLAPGTVLTPFVRLGNERAEAVGRVRVVVRDSGEITWRRLVRPFRQVSVHLRGDGVKSNAVTWQRIR